MKNSERESSLSSGEGTGVRFKKSERLSREKWIKELFEMGSSFYLYPFKVLYAASPDQKLPHQVLISVSSRNFKRAVDRNLIKRRVREAYRLQKKIIAGRAEQGIFSFVYTSKSIMPFAEIKNKLFLVLEKIRNLESL